MNTPLPKEIAAAVKRIELLAQRQRKFLASIHQISELAMANEQDLTNEIDSFKAKVAAREATIAAHEAAHKQIEDAANATIADLQKQLAAGNDTQPFIDQLEAIKALIPTDAPADAQIPSGETAVDNPPE